MNIFEKILKESLVRIAVSNLCEPIKEKLAEIGVSWEYKITEIDIEKINKLAHEHAKNVENGDSNEESLDKILGKKPQNDNNKDDIVSEELLKYFMDKEKNNETTKADN